MWFEIYNNSSNLNPIRYVWLHQDYIVLVSLLIDLSKTTEGKFTTYKYSQYLVTHKK